MVQLLFLLACGESKPCPKDSQEACPPCSEAEPSGASDGVMISVQEHEILDSYLEDVRNGVVAWSPESVGICERGEKSYECEKYVGLSLDSVPEGNYIIRGEFKVPELRRADDWKIKLDVNCDINRNGTTRSKTFNREYAVKYSGSKHGYRMGLYPIVSPSVLGEETCTWKLEANNLEKPMVWEGTYVIPYKAKEP